MGGCRWCRCAGCAHRPPPDVISCNAMAPPYAHAFLLQALCAPGLRARHWEALSVAVGAPVAPGPGFTLAAAEKMGLLAHMEAVSKVADVAAKEYSIEQVGRGAVLRWVQLCHLGCQPLAHEVL